MRSQGLSKAGLEELHEVTAGHVAAGRGPCLVLGLAGTAWPLYDYRHVR